MKKCISILLILFLGIFLSACSTQKQADDSKQQPIDWQNGTPVTVSGKVPGGVFHSVDFNDQNNGWLVKDLTQGDKQVSEILQTTDGGKTWSSLLHSNIQIKKVLFVSENTGWIITQEEITQPGQETGIVKIQYTDNGKTWDTQWQNNITLKGNYDLCFANEKIGYALTGGILLSTVNGGKEWSKVSFGVKGFVPQHISFVDTDTGWIIGKVIDNESGNKDKLLVLRTTDGGQHWQQQFEKITPEDQLVNSIDIDFINQSTGWFLTSNLETWTGELFYTADSGQNWQKINEIKCVRSTPEELEFVNKNTGWIPLNVGAGPVAGGLLLTKDGGKHFKIINNDQYLNSMIEIGFTSAKDGWAVGTSPNQGNYLVRTNDGGETWFQVFPKIRPTEDISFIDNNKGFGLGQLSDSGVLLFTADGGDTWQKEYSFSEKYRPSRITFIDDKKGWILATPIDGNKTVILNTLDGGKTWEVIKGNIPPVDIWSVTYFKFINADDGILINNANNINFYYTNDGGNSWQMSEKKRLDGQYQYSFISDKQGWEVYSSQSNIIDLSHTQDGLTWESLGQTASNSRAYGINFISEQKGILLIEEPPFQSDSVDKLLITSDGGKDWSSHPFPREFKLEMFKNEIPIQFTDDNHGWILSGQGLLKTEDGGKNWSWELNEKK